MKLSLKSLTITTALFWSGTISLIAFINFLFPPYGKAFLDLVSSIYPGYKVVGSFTSVIIGTLYGLLDGAIAGALFAWLYNCFASES